MPVQVAENKQKADAELTVLANEKHKIKVFSNKYKIKSDEKYLYGIIRTVAVSSNKCPGHDCC